MEEVYVMEEVGGICCGGSREVYVVEEVVRYMLWRNLGGICCGGGICFGGN